MPQHNQLWSYFFLWMVLRWGMVVQCVLKTIFAFVTNINAINWVTKWNEISCACCTHIQSCFRLDPFDLVLYVKLPQCIFNYPSYHKGIALFYFIIEAVCHTQNITAVCKIVSPYLKSKREQNLFLKRDFKSAALIQVVRSDTSALSRDK